MNGMCSGGLLACMHACTRVGVVGYHRHTDPLHVFSDSSSIEKREGSIVVFIEGQGHEDDSFAFSITNCICFSFIKFSMALHDTMLVARAKLEYLTNCSGYTIV
jgi:hypothetical protein